MSDQSKDQMTGFNENELEDIMSEIENLENDIQDHESELDVEEPKEEVEEVTATEETPDAEVEKFSQQLEEMEMPEEKVQELDPMEEAKLIIEAEEGGKQETVETESVDEVHVEEQRTDNSHIEKPLEESVISIHKAKDKHTVDHAQIFDTENLTTETLSKSKTATTKMDFSVSGHMNLHLNFTIGGQSVGLEVSEKEGLVIHMGNGAKFTLPIEETNSVKDTWKKTG